MQNNFKNNDGLSRSSTPSLGFASSSGHLSNVQYNSPLNAFQSQQQPHQNGFNSPLSPYGNAVGGNSNFNGFASTPQQVNAPPILNMNASNKFMQPPQAFNPMMKTFPPSSHLAVQTPQISQPIISGTPYQQMSVPNLVSNWNYLDINNEVRGPFTSMQMDSWLTGGYFNNDLRICHVSCSPMNPFDDVKVSLSYPYGLNNTKYVTLKELMELSNGNFNQNTFFNYDCLCTMIMKDFLNRGFAANMNSPHLQAPLQSQKANMMKNNTLLNPVTPLVMQPFTNANNDLEKPYKVVSHDESIKSSEITMPMSKISSVGLVENKETVSKSTIATTLSFKEALFLKTPSHPAAYNHVQRKKVGVHPSNTKITRKGIYDQNYYLASDYTYNELFNHGIKDAIGNECSYQEHTAYMPVGKVVDDIIESENWPDDFYKSQDCFAAEDDLAKLTFNPTVPQPEKVSVPNKAEILKSSKYFARVHETRLKSSGDYLSEPTLLQEDIIVYASTVIQNLVYSIDKRTPYIDGTVITYLSKVNADVLKKLFVAIRIILDSKVPFFNSVYSFVADNICTLLPKSHLVFNKSIDLLDLPYDKETFELLSSFFKSIDFASANSIEFIRKSMEILKFFDANNEPYKNSPVLLTFINSPEYKKAKIDLLISRIDDDSSSLKKKKKKRGNNEAQIFNDTWKNVELNLFTKDLPIHYYLTQGLDPRANQLEMTYKAMPLFFWTKYEAKNSTVIKVDTPVPLSKSIDKLVEVKTELKTINNKTTAETKNKKLTSSSEVSLAADHGILNSQKIKPNTTDSKVHLNLKEKKLENKLEETVIVKKSPFAWEKDEKTVAKASILDIINEKKKEEKRLKEAKKSEPVKAYEAPRDFIREALLKEENAAKQSSGAGTLLLKKNEFTNSDFRQVIEQKREKVSSASTDSSSAGTPKKNVMPDTYVVNSSKPKSNARDALSELLEEKKKLGQSKAKTPVFNDDFIKEQEKLLRELELKKKQDDASWVTIDKKKAPKVKNGIQIAKTSNSAILNPEKLRKIAGPKALKSAVPETKTTNTSSTSSVKIPFSSQKEFIQWCEKNLGDADFLAVLFSMEQANVSFFVDMVNSTASSKPKINGKTAAEFFKIKAALENSKGFLSWNEALSNLNTKDDDWSFQTVVKKK